VDFLWVRCVPIGQDDIGSALDLCDPRLSDRQVRLRLVGQRSTGRPDGVSSPSVLAGIQRMTPGDRAKRSRNKVARYGGPRSAHPVRDRALREKVPSGVLGLADSVSI